MSRSRYLGPLALPRRFPRSVSGIAVGNTFAGTRRISTIWNTNLLVGRSLQALFTPENPQSSAAYVCPDPVKYETLIRHFQSRAEKDAEAQAKGYSRVLEGDLMRSEAKLAALQASLTGVDGVDGGELTASRQGEGDSSAAPGTDYDDDFEPTTKEEGRELWNEFLTERFVRGKDPDFDYSKVDDDESLDAMERQDEQDAWFDEEEPSWASDDGTDAKMLQGETGIQDF